MKLQMLVVLLWIFTHLAWAQDTKLTWETVVEGYGQKAKTGDRLSVSYVLKLDNGEVIDSTPPNKPFRFTIGSKKIIQGLNEGVLGMQRGETRKIVIPPSLGYGSSKVGPIPANSTLHFEVELENFIKASEGDSLADKFGKEGFENRPDARNLDKPAMFEYLIRDFFTRPWRYADAAKTIWKSNAWLTLLAVLVWLVCFWQERRGPKR